MSNNVKNNSTLSDYKIKYAVKFSDGNVYNMSEVVGDRELEEVANNIKDKFGKNFVKFSRECEKMIVSCRKSLGEYTDKKNPMSDFEMKFFVKTINGNKLLSELVGNRTVYQASKEIVEKYGNSFSFWDRDTRRMIASCNR